MKPTTNWHIRCSRISPSSKTKPFVAKTNLVLEMPGLSTAVICVLAAPGQWPGFFGRAGNCRKVPLSWCQRVEGTGDAPEENDRDNTEPDATVLGKRAGAPPAHSKVCVSYAGPEQPLQPPNSNTTCALCWLLLLLPPSALPLHCRSYSSCAPRANTPTRVLCRE